MSKTTKRVISISAKRAEQEFERVAQRALQRAQDTRMIRQRRRAAYAIGTLAALCAMGGAILAAVILG